MSLSIEDNIREPWSRITDTHILQPGDELRVEGRNVMAMLAVLDSHDPGADARAYVAEMMGLTGQRPLGHHHHVLVQLEDSSEVLSTGLYVGRGGPEDLFFAHMTHLQEAEGDYGDRLRRLHIAIGGGIHGLYFMSDKEQLSVLPGALPYLNVQGGLLLR